MEKDKEIDKKEEQIRAKELDEFFENAKRIPKEVLGSELGLAVFKEKSRENREYKTRIDIFQNENRELKETIARYEERMSWKNIVSVVSSVLLGISFFLISENQPNVSLILIGVVFIINLMKLGRFRLPIRFNKKSEKI